MKKVSRPYSQTNDSCQHNQVKFNVNSVNTNSGPEARNSNDSAAASVEYAEAILEQSDAEESSVAKRHSHATQQVIQLLLRRYPNEPPAWVKRVICQLSAVDLIINEG